MPRKHRGSTHKRLPYEQSEIPEVLDETVDIEEPVEAPPDKPKKSYAHLTSDQVRMLINRCDDTINRVQDEQSKLVSQYESEAMTARLKVNKQLSDLILPLEKEYKQNKQKLDAWKSAEQRKLDLEYEQRLHELRMDDKQKRDSIEKTIERELHKIDTDKNTKIKNLDDTHGSRVATYLQEREELKSRLRV